MTRDDRHRSLLAGLFRADCRNAAGQAPDRAGWKRRDGWGRHRTDFALKAAARGGLVQLIAKCAKTGGGTKLTCSDGS